MNVRTSMFLVTTYVLGLIMGIGSVQALASLQRTAEPVAAEPAASRQPLLLLQGRQSH